MNVIWLGQKWNSNEPIMLRHWNPREMIEVLICSVYGQTIVITMRWLEKICA